MYNIQFHHPSFNPQQQQQQHQQQEDVTSVTAAAVLGNDNKTFAPSLDSSADDIGLRKQSFMQPSSGRNSPKTGRQYDIQSYNTTPMPSYKQQIPVPQQTGSPKKEGQNTSFYQTPSAEDWIEASTSENAFATQQQQQSQSPSETNLDDEMQQRHMQLLFEKKRRRRESHNAVERRRRDTINERIFELSTLLPERDASKNNKGTILKKSVDHIRFLHEEIRQYQHRTQELEGMLEMYRVRMGSLLDRQPPPAPAMIPSNHPLDLSGMQPHPSYRRDI
ncbi:hypothetical protein EC973_002310 [Apophysomyces ossiformis]|uniref:BHLH domain-containing protein n=1 Tax=Apophysomyces ossiformis TaxID=679940 RepID=A0A8H7BN50_9FUNG|nr:hypothetical protein EC973_002310 [Apophysomyces ossiformis]